MKPSCCDNTPLILLLFAACIFLPKMMIIYRYFAMHEIVGIRETAVDRPSLKISRSMEISSMWTISRMTIHHH